MIHFPVVPMDDKFSLYWSKPIGVQKESVLSVVKNFAEAIEIASKDFNISQEEMA